MYIFNFYLNNFMILYFRDFIIKYSLESIVRRFTSCDDETLSAYEHLNRRVYIQSDGARHIFAPLQYITALVPAMRGSRVYIVNIRRDLRRINNIRIAARGRAADRAAPRKPFHASRACNPARACFGVIAFITSGFRRNQ